ncbi:MAG: amino acid permease [Planctomycetaceae bacterium]|nr:amino acid permease [Planctomycetaceae bacterium]
MSQDAQRFGTGTLTCLVFAGMIGAGVFTTSGFTIGALQSPAWVLVAWAVGGVIAICGAVSYGALARRLPESGGEYVFLARGLHPFFGFLAGMVSLTAGFSGPIALSALTFEEYLLPAAIRPTWWQGGMAAIPVILLCGVGHALHVRLSTRVQNAVVVLKVAVLLLVLLAAAAVLSSHAWHWESLANANDTADSFGNASPWRRAFLFSEQLMWISLSYLGFNAAVYLSSEAREPKRTIPAALILGTTLVTILYVLLNLIFVTAGHPADIAFKPDVAAIAIRQLNGEGFVAQLLPRIFGINLETVLRIAVVLAMFTSVAGGMLIGPRVYARMAADRLFPRFFLAPGHNYRNAVLLQTALAVPLAAFSSIPNLLNLLGTTLSLCSVLAVTTLFLPLRPTIPQEKDETAFQLTPPIATCAVCYILATMTAVIMKFIGNPTELIWMAGAIVVTGAIHIAARPK